jgi:hypothetical protein
MQDIQPAQRSRAVIGFTTVAAFLAALLLPVLSPAEVSNLEVVARDIAVGVVNISAIWFGMLFSVAMERAEQGRAGGAPELVLQLLRPLKFGGLTLLGTLLATVFFPILDRFAATASLFWSVLFARGHAFIALMLCVGAFYGLLLALAPIQHILHMLRVREAEADAKPPFKRTDEPFAGHAVEHQNRWR